MVSFHKTQSPVLGAPAPVPGELFIAQNLILKIEKQNKGKLETTISVQCFPTSNNIKETVPRANNIDTPSSLN